MHHYGAFLIPACGLNFCLLVRNVYPSQIKVGDRSTPMMKRARPEPARARYGLNRDSGCRSAVVRIAGPWPGRTLLHAPQAVDLKLERRPTMPYKKTLAILPCAVLCAGMSLSALAQEQPGMIVVRDPQTGQLRAPTAAESRALAPPSSPGMRAAQVQPALVTHPGGSRQVRLGERGLVYSVVTRGPDGKMAEQCVQGAAAADKAVHAPVSTQHNEEHRHD
jgi:hypothetical protein